MLLYLLDVISVHEAQRPGKIRTGSGEPIVVVMAMDNEADKEFYASYGFEERCNAETVVEKSVEENDEKVQFGWMALRQGEIQSLVRMRRAGVMDGEDKWTRWRKECEHERALRLEKSAVRRKTRWEFKQMKDVSEEITQKQELLKKVLKEQNRLKKEIEKRKVCKKNHSKHDIWIRCNKEEVFQKQLKVYAKQRETLEQQIFDLETLMKSWSRLENSPRGNGLDEVARLPPTEEIAPYEQPGERGTLSLFEDLVNISGAGYTEETGDIVESIERDTEMGLGRERRWARSLSADNDSELERV